MRTKMEAQLLRVERASFGLQQRCCANVSRVSLQLRAMIANVNYGLRESLGKYGENTDVFLNARMCG
ncbi:MAG: hypothetical protein ACK5JM_01755 [Rhodoblastus sp.]